ncbi:hypothetical protein HanXRQr2_Chr14g0622061 [Helianthus annuus]|uniref:Uncharacterized protein n=1 Tax=Helianthus annuus TaxID=4232 RepID=A0A9K3H6T1_HELAN|nr:hypothetical protein HanXRQr2_Chr14g0622061 [Helianthus annuus]
MFDFNAFIYAFASLHCIGVVVKLAPWFHCFASALDFEMYLERLMMVWSLSGSNYHYKKILQQ